MRPSPGWVGLGCALLGLVVAAAALAAAPAVGTYKAKGQFAFGFTIAVGNCASAPTNLTNPKARGGPVKKGLCLGVPAADSVLVKPKCPAGASVLGAIVDPGVWSGFRFSSAGVVHVKVWTYNGGTPNPIGFYELYLSVHGKHGTGYVSEATTAYAGGKPVQCTTGKLAFTAHA